jgi:hypothetical protein
MLQEVTKKLFEYSMTPMQKAMEFRSTSLQDESICLEATQALGARALFIAQVIVSLIALPIFLLGMFLVPPLQLCAKREGEVLAAATAFGKMCLVHLSIIPTALISACLPHSLECETPLRQAWEACNFN